MDFPFIGDAMAGLPALTNEEFRAIADEARRLGLVTTCHTYGIGEGAWGCVEAPFDVPMHMMDADHDPELIREMAARGLLKGRAGNERRFLMLMYSLDALNWFPAGCVAAWPSPGQGFQYNALLVDGDDLLVSSRTAKNAPNQHDNDLVTIHRVHDFRSLALNLHPVV